MPVDEIVAAVVGALSAGATETGKKVVGDAYEGLKGLIKRKFGAESEAATALDKLEARPESDARKSVLKEELEASGAAIDEDLVAAAEALLARLKGLPGGDRIAMNAHGTGIAQASHGGTATVTMTGGVKKDG